MGMDQKHSVKKFDQMLKRSFQPGTSEIPPKKAAKTKLKRGPLASTSTMVDFNNNKVKIEKNLALSTEDFNNNKVKIEKDLALCTDDFNSNKVKIEKTE